MLLVNLLLGLLFSCSGFLSEILLFWWLNLVSLDLSHGWAYAVISCFLSCSSWQHILNQPWSGSAPGFALPAHHRLMDVTPCVHPPGLAVLCFRDQGWGTWRLHLVLGSPSHGTALLLLLSDNNKFSLELYKTFLKIWTYYNYGHQVDKEGFSLCRSQILLCWTWFTQVLCGLDHNYRLHHLSRAENLSL